MHLLLWELVILITFENVIQLYSYVVIFYHYCLFLNLLLVLFLLAILSVGWQSANFKNLLHETFNKIIIGKSVF